MKELEEQRVGVCLYVCMKFCCKLGKNFTETFQLLNQEYVEDCMSRTQCQYSRMTGRTGENRENSSKSIMSGPLQYEATGSTESFCFNKICGRKMLVVVEWQQLCSRVMGHLDKLSQVSIIPTTRANKANVRYTQYPCALSSPNH